MSDLSILIVLLAIIFTIGVTAIVKLVIEYKLELNNRMRVDAYEQRTRKT